MKILFTVLFGLSLGLGCSPEKGPQGTQGPRGFEGKAGDTGAQGATGAQGPRGNAGNTGPAGPDGTSCTTAAIDGGVSISCTDGTVSILSHGQDGQNGQNGQNGQDGQNGTNGTSCSTEATDGGIRVSCTDGTASFIAHGIDGNDGRSCQAQPADGGVLLSCDDGSQAWFRNGQDGTDGDDGETGANGTNGDDGTSCSTASVDGGARVICTDGTASFLRHGIDGVDGINGLNGENGEDGDDCFITSITNGVTITCGSGDTATVESLQHGNSCSVSTAGNGLSVSCGEGDSVSTGAISGFSSVEPFGMAMINDASGTLSQNDTLFLRFLSPATGVFDHLALMSGGNNTDVQLEVGLFTTDDFSNWYLVEESNVITFSDPTEDAYRRITGSGLNAFLEQHVSYKIGIRNLSTTPWSYSSFTPTGNLPGTRNNGARMCALRATAELDSYRDGTTVNIEDMSHGHGKRPWFRVNQ